MTPSPVPTSRAGGPGRRRVLQLGAAGLAAALLAACRGGGDRPAQPDLPTDIVGDTPTDLTVLRTATSLEQLAVEVYATVLESGVLTDPAVAALLELFQSHHDLAAADFTAALLELDGTPPLRANEVVQAAVTDPALEALEDQDGALRLAREVEELVAATHQHLVVRLGTPELRQEIVGIAAAEVRHATALRDLLAEPLVPQAFQSAEPAAGDDALLPEPTELDDDAEDEGDEDGDEDGEDAGEENGGR